MGGMWRLVVEVARKSRLQLFATTHSQDCILGLASMIKSYPELADEVSVHKIDTSLPQSRQCPRDGHSDRPRERCRLSLGSVHATTIKPSC